jgi:hypothetical protein
MYTKHEKIAEEKITETRNPAGWSTADVVGPAHFGSLAMHPGARQLVTDASDTK